MGDQRLYAAQSKCAGSFVAAIWPPSMKYLLLTSHLSDLYSGQGCFELLFITVKYKLCRNCFFDSILATHSQLNKLNSFNRTHISSQTCSPCASFLSYIP